MSLKYKIPLLMLFVFSLNLGLLLAYFHFVLADKVTGNLNALQNDITALCGELAKDINGKSVKDAEQYLSEYQGNGGLIFILKNTDNGEITEINPRNASKVGFAAIELVVLDGTQYVFLVQRDVAVLNLRSHTAITDLIYFECLVMFVILILAGVILYFRWVKPLVRLRDNMNQYNPEKPPRTSVYRKDEIGQLERSFNSLLKSLNLEKQTQKRIIASISHDIKTPLTSVMGYAERLIKKEFEKEKQIAYLNTIYSQARDIEAVVLDFDDYLGNGLESKLKPELYDTAYIGQMLSDEYVRQLGEKGIGISIKNSTNPGSKIKVDLAKLRRVFANIIGNAIRHGNTENLSIIIAVEEIEDHLKFTVSDNGQGVPESELPYIFEPFYTSDKSRRISGLGLSICKNIILSHGGRISAGHNQNGGLTISMELPLLVFKKVL